MGPQGERVVPAGRFYQNDGIDYLTKHPDEILTEVRLPAPNGWDAVYRKLRRRRSFDFPMLGVAVWVQWEGNTIADARLVLGGVASHPQEVPECAAAIRGTPLSDETIAAAAEAAYRPAKPMDNTNFDLSWRKQTTRVYLKGCLRSCGSGAERGEQSSTWAGAYGATLWIMLRVAIDPAYSARIMLRAVYAASDAAFLRPGSWPRRRVDLYREG